MKGTVLTTRQYHLDLTEEEAEALSKMAGYIQLGDLQPAFDRAQMDQKDRSGEVLIELMMAVQKMVAERHRG